MNRISLVLVCFTDENLEHNYNQLSVHLLCGGTYLSWYSLQIVKKKISLKHATCIYVFLTFFDGNYKFTSMLAENMQSCSYLLRNILMIYISLV